MRRTYTKCLAFKPKCLKLINAFIILFYFTIPGFNQDIFKDSLNHSVSLKKYPPQRIISLAPNITEIIYAIGSEDQLIGVTDWCRYPKEAQKKEKIGGFINPNLEKIISLKPDLVIQTADSNQNKIYDQLTRFNIPVYVINPDNLDSTFDSIIQIAKLCGKDKEVRPLVTKLRRRVETIQEKLIGVNQPSILFLWSEDPLITAGQNTFTDNLIELAGGINIAHDSKIKYPKFSMEEILRRKPDIIIISSMEFQETGTGLYQKWQNWTEIPAIQNNKVYSIDMDLIARPGPSIVNGLEKLAEIIHPEIFNKKEKNN